MAPRRSYMICTTPRSGSYMLSDALARTGQVGIPTERFPPPQPGELTAELLDELVTRSTTGVPFDKEADAKYVRQIIEAGTTPNGVFGIKIHWFQLNDALQRLAAFATPAPQGPDRLLESAFPNLGYIWLRRRDAVAQAVSWSKAIQSGEYTRGLGGAGPRPDAELQFNYQKIQTYLSSIRSSDTGWRLYFEEYKIQPLVVIYEDLTSDFINQMRKIINFIDPALGDLQIDAPRAKKQADRMSQEWIAEFLRIRNQKRPANTGSQL